MILIRYKQNLFLMQSGGSRMRMSLREAVGPVSPRTPVKVIVPSHWMSEYDGLSRELEVVITSYNADSDSIQFHTAEHGPSRRVSDSREVTVLEAAARYASIRLDYQSRAVVKDSQGRHISVE